MRTSPVTALLCVAVTTLGLGGCADRSASSPDQSNARDAATTRIAQDGGGTVAVEPLLNSPLQQFRLRPSEYALITYARGVLIDRCMRRAGFRYPLGPWTDALRTTLINERIALSRIYGITDPAAASAYGYGFPPADDPSPSTGVERAHDTRYRLALHGPSATPEPSNGKAPRVAGCAGEADQILENDDPTRSVYGLGHTLWIESMSGLSSTREYRLAINQWSACMREQGFRVTDPVEDEGAIRAALDSRYERGDTALTAEPEPEEVALALADVTCKRSSRMVRKLDQIAGRMAREVITRRRADLAAERDRLVRQLTKARRVLNETGSGPGSTTQSDHTR